MPLNDHPLPLPGRNIPEDPDLVPLSATQHLLFLLFIIASSIPSIVGSIVILRWLWRLARALAHIGIVL